MHRTLTPRKTLVVVVLSLLALFALAGGAQSVTPAGTPIGNQATATYTDGSLVVRQVTSNVVITSVQQVGAVTLQYPGAKTATQGAQVVYSHTITNAGNGPDTFSLSVVAAPGTGFTPINAAIYIDANGDGIADNSTNLNNSTISLAAGASVNVLVTGTVPASATGTGLMTITAASVLNVAQAQTNQDTTTVTGNAVINVTKSLSASSGASGTGPYTVTLTYTNNGNATATAVTLKDTLPSGMTYVSGSAHWSVTGNSVALFETGVAQPSAGSPNIKYSWSAGNPVLAIIDSVPVGTSGQLTFSVNIANGLAPGPIINTAYYNYNDGNSVVPGVGAYFSTNAATFTVAQTAGVTISTPTAILTAAQGATISFTNTVTNTGNGTDTFNITTSASTYPTGTTFALFKSDGVTPILDSNGDGIVDIGPLAAGATYNVIVKATLPPTISGGTVPYTVNVTATSTVTGTVKASAPDVLTGFTTSTVDITVDGFVKGFGPGPGSVQVTNTVAPGASTYFTLYVTNTSTLADTYNLVASTSGAFGTSNTLLPGWTVTFTNASSAPCSASTAGSTITNTGVVNGGANKLVCAIVTIAPGTAPATFPATTQSLYFQSLSPTTTAADSIQNAVTVSTVHNLSLAPNNSGQVYPGGTVVYSHVLTNNGNVTETVASVLLTSNGDSQSSFTSTIFRDNGSLANQLDSTDSSVSAGTAVLSTPLAPGSSVVLFAKVGAPAAAAIGAVDVTTITITYGGSSTTVATDTSTVIAGDLRLAKTQAPDASCAGTAGSYVSSSLVAKSGTCLFYQITATNQGTAAVNTVSISDATPTNTTYFGSKYAPTCTVAGTACTSLTPTAGTLTFPASDGVSGTVTATVPTLAPGASAIITFEVKIN